MIVITNHEGVLGLDTAVSLLREQKDALDVIEEAVSVVEDAPSVLTVGNHSFPNMLGALQFDAAICDGDGLRAGAVGALEGYRSAIRVARKVMEQSPHVLLVGEGAARFAKEVGAEPLLDVSEQTKNVYLKWLSAFNPEKTSADIQNSSLLELQSTLGSPAHQKYLDAYLQKASTSGIGTTIYCVVDHAKHCVSGVSTSGWPFKYPGRLGDSPLIGAGIYCVQGVGASGCVGLGEMAIRANLAQTVVHALEMGASCQEACYEGCRVLSRLYLSDQLRSIGRGVCIHAIDQDENHYVVDARIQERDEKALYGIWHDGFETWQLREAEIVLLKSV